MASASELTVRQERLYRKCLAVTPGNIDAAIAALRAATNASDADQAVVLQALEQARPNGRRAD